MLLEASFFRFIKTEEINPSSLSVWGKYQIQRCLVILVIIWLPTSFHLLNMVFYRAETDYWCQRYTISKKVNE